MTPCLICDKDHLMPEEIKAQRSVRTEVVAGACRSLSSFCSSSPIFIPRHREPSLHWVQRMCVQLSSGTVGGVPEIKKMYPALGWSGIQSWGQESSQGSHSLGHRTTGRLLRAGERTEAQRCEWLPEITQHSGRTESCLCYFSSADRKQDYWKIFPDLLLICGSIFSLKRGESDKSLSYTINLHINFWKCDLEIAIKWKHTLI